MLVMNTAFFILLAIYTDDLSQYYKNVHSHLDPGFMSKCGTGAILIQVLRTIPVLLNDIVFVSHCDRNFPETDMNV
jgi:hypothetical protein